LETFFHPISVINLMLSCSSGASFFKDIQSNSKVVPKIAIQHCACHYLSVKWANVQLDMGALVLQYRGLRVGCVTDTVILLRNRIAVRLGLHMDAFQLLHFAGLNRCQLLVQQMALLLFLWILAVANGPHCSAESMWSTYVTSVKKILSSLFFSQPMYRCLLKQWRTGWCISFLVSVVRDGPY
jgi:hypothetical protein